jgi:hypothetical protein
MRGARGIGTVTLDPPSAGRAALASDLRVPALARPEAFKVIPEKAAGYEKKPHFACELSIVRPAIVEHPVRASAHEEKEAYRKAAGDRVILQIPFGENHYPQLDQRH